MFEVSTQLLNHKKIERQFRFLGDQVPKWTAVGMTNTIKQSKQAVQQAMPMHIDRPTPWTKRSLFFFPAEKEDLRAAVAFKWESGRRPRSDIGMFGAPQSMRMQVYGGSRDLKGFEKRLRASGITPPDRPYLVPSRALKRDRYGNVTRAQLNRILYSGSAGGTVTERPIGGARRHGSSRKGQSFVMRKNGRKIGIFKNEGRYSYTKTHKRPTPQFWFDRQPRYHSRFDFHGIAARGASKLVPNVYAALDRGVQRYLRS